MPSRVYVLTDPAEPEVFKDALYEALLERKNITVKARPQLDELAKRRGDTAAETEYELNPLHLNLDPDNYFVDVVDVREGRWIHLLATQHDVRFTIRGEEQL